MKQRAWQEEVMRLATGIRRRALQQALRNGGYLSQACSSAEILAVLYGCCLRLGVSQAPFRPGPFVGTPPHAGPPGYLYHGGQAADCDRLVLSPTHYALCVYAALAETGRLDPDSLVAFNTDGSILEMIGSEHSPGLEVTGGSFGQAISQALGICWARRRSGDSGRVFVFMSDGEFQEGQVWEALLSASFHGLSNLRVIVDVNGQQVDGRMETVMGIEPIADKLRAFGFDVAEVDGHDIDALEQALSGAYDRPFITLAYTDPTRGIPALSSRYPNLHYVRFSSQEDREPYLRALELMETTHAL